MKLNPSRIGVQLYTLRDRFQTYDEVVNTLRIVRDIGYEAVQFYQIPIDISDMKKILDELGLSVCGVDVSIPRLHNELAQVLKEMEQLNCHYITGSYEGDRNKSYVDGLDDYIDAISEIGESLKSSDCRFAYHNHSFEFIKREGRPLLDYFYEKTKAAGILAEIDTYWVQHGGGDPAKWIQNYKGRVPIIHLKDLSIEMVNDTATPVFAEVGNGNMNWDAILQSAEKADVEWVVVEQDYCNKDPFESVKESYEYVKSILAQ
jgi:sugar phosphate isomerase/epimerase